MLPEHAHLSPVLAGLQELPGRRPLLGARGLAAQGRCAGHPGGLHAPHLRQHAGGLQASSQPGEPGLFGPAGPPYGRSLDEGRTVKLFQAVKLCFIQLKCPF